MSGPRDRVVIVTGAAAGIGRATALRFAAEGSRVAAFDVDEAKGRPLAAELDGAGGQGHFARVDVADARSVEAGVAGVVERWGRIDVLVNNAGILRDRMIFNMAEEEFDLVVRVHLKGTFNCSRHAARHMREQKSGRIISMTSTSGLYGNSGQANYGAAKDGIAGFTRVVSRELGKYSINVNAIAPAAATRMTATVSDSARQARAARGIASMGDKARALLPRAQREAEDIAPFAVYLASPAAANINGQIFVVMGGIISLVNYPAPVRTITSARGWTPEEIAALFPSTLGMDLFNPAPAQTAAEVKS